MATALIRAPRSRRSAPSGRDGRARSGAPRVRRGDRPAGGGADVEDHTAFAARAKVDVTAVHPQPPRHLRDEKRAGERVAAAAQIRGTTRVVDQPPEVVV